MAAGDPPPPGGSGNIITRKYGPLPGYAYLGIAGVGAYVIIKRRGASSTADATDTSDTTDDTGLDDSETGEDSTDLADEADEDGQDPDYGSPYGQTGGQVYTTLASADASLQTDQAKLAAKNKRINKLTGEVAPKTRVVTVTAADENKTAIAAKYKTTVKEIEKLNPTLNPIGGKKAAKLKVGQKVLVPVAS
jgi:LysM repeat protein